MEVGGSIAEVQTLIHELRRITILWDELWLGTLAQHHSELTRKCGQLKSDIARLNRNPSLNSEEKNQLIRKKYDIVFQPVSRVCLRAVLFNSELKLHSLASSGLVIVVCGL